MKNKVQTNDALKADVDVKAQKDVGFFSVGLKLNLTVSLILIMFLLGVTYIAAYFFKNDSITRIQETVSDKSRVLSLKVQEDLHGIESEAKLLGLTFSFADSFVSRKERNPAPSVYRRQLLEQNESIFYVAAVRFLPDGKLSVVESASNEKLIRKGYSSPPNFSAVLRSNSIFAENAAMPNLLISNVSSIFNAPTLVATMPFVINNDGRVQTALVAFFSMQVFLSGLETYSEYLSYIVNERGEIVAHPDANLLVNRISFAKNEIVKAALTSPIDNTQMSYTNEEGKERVGSFYKIPLGNLTIVSSVDKETALLAVRRLARRNILITLAALFFSIMVIYLFAKTLTSPVKKLVAASKRVVDGEYKLNLKSKSKDEIGVLTNSFVSMAEGLEEREKMKEAFGKFVNEQIADMAMKGEIKLGGERKDVTIFFSDIRSFTAISESMQPEQVVEFLNEYMTAMVDCVNETHGIVDKYIGDAIMAVWGTPISHGNDAENAVNGALMMRESLRKFNEGRGGEGKPIIKIGCGINTGPVLAGQIGSSSRMEYTVIGDAVNLASRVEALNKPFGTDVLITSDTYARVKDIFDVEPMKKIKVKGKKDPQQIYAVIARKDNPLYKNLQDVRDALGIAYVDPTKVDTEKEEVKYEIT